MASRTYRAAQVAATVNYFLTGGPNGGPLSPEQFWYQLSWGLLFGRGNITQNGGMPAAQQSFGDMLRMAIQAEIANPGTYPALQSAPYLVRDQFGNLRPYLPYLNWLYTDAVQVG
jgi:hypothetical protein